ncbi:MAG: DUF4105 domain-containing protein [Kofleriaceae bacterium]
MLVVDLRSIALRLLLAVGVAACATTTGRLTRDVAVALPRDATANTYLRELLDRAHKERLSSKTEWRRLGHWRRTLMGFTESQADGPNFFLSSSGRSNPSAELDATLRGFFATIPADATDIQHPICQFPARYRFLDRALHFDATRLAKPACPRYDEFLTRVNAQSLSFVFSSYYLNNPASVFGHTFVRIVKKAETKDEERHELLDYSVEFSATVDTSNALIYGVKGLLGLFPGTFRNVPYYFKVRQYNDYESRDLYEYELNLSPAELDAFLSHLWELGSTFFDYYYVSENCSYHLLGALEAIRPDLDLLSHMHWPVIPADTIKALYANPGLVKAIRFRPSLRRQFLERLSHLDSEQRDVVEKLVEKPATPLPADVKDTRAIAVLDAAQDLIDIRHAKAITHDVNSAAGRLKQTLLERRAEITMPSNPLSVDTPWKLMPQFGHDSRRIGVGFAADDGWGKNGSDAMGVTLDARLALHDLADPTPGYPEFSQLEFLPTRARIRTDDPDTKRFELESISLVRIISLSPQDRFDRKLSWKVDLGAVRLDDEGCQGRYCYIGQLALGTGAAFASANARAIAFLTLDAHVGYGPSLDGLEGAPFRLGAGPSGGLRFRLASRFVWLTTGELIWLPDQAPTTTWEAKTIFRFGVAKNFALSAEGHIDAQAATGSFTTLLYF